MGARAARRHPAVAQRRTDAGRHRRRDRRAHRQGDRPRGPGRARLALPCRAQAARGLHPCGTRRAAAPALLLLGLPPQHVHQGSRGLARGGRHRLPLHGAVDEPPYRDLHADGRRRRDLDRPGLLHRHAPHLRQPRRWHLHALRIPGHPRRPGGGREHHLQDPRQRRRRHDRRTAGRGRAHGAADPAADGGRGRAPHPARERRARCAARASRPAGGHRHQPSRPHGRHPARNARETRRVGHRLRADLRRRETPPPQTRQAGRSGPPRAHQRGSLRGMRRLRRAVELRVHPAAGDPAGPQTHHRPKLVQQGLLVREGVLPQLRHGRGRRAAQAGGAAGGAATGSARAGPTRAGTGMEHRRDRRGRHGRGHDRRADGHRRPPRRQGRRRAGHGRAGAERRRGDVARTAGGHPCGAARHPGSFQPGRRRAGLRPDGRLRPGRHRHDGDDAHPCGAKPGRVAHRRLHPGPRLASLARSHAATRARGGLADRGGGRHRDRHRPPGRRDRHQCLHAGLRVAEGLDPAARGFPDAGDRTECRGRGDEQGRVRLGPAGRAGPAGGQRRRRTQAARHGGDDAAAPVLAGCAAGRPHAAARPLPERRLCRPLRDLRARDRRPGRGTGRRQPAGAHGRGQPLQAHGLQG